LISITVQGEIVARLDKIPHQLQAAIEEKFRSSILDIYHQAVLRFSNGKYSDTDEVVYGVEKISPSMLVGYIEPVTTKAIVQEFGGKSYYEILPVKGRFLRFLSKEGEIVFAKRVFHPPTPAKHYILRSIEEYAPHLKSMMEEAIRQGIS